MTTLLLGDAAKDRDARSSRSRQRKLGPSSIGTCRRRAGYEHHGEKPSNPENVTGLPAILGTWIHKGALETMRQEWGAIIETTVEDDILRGHVDALFLPVELLSRLPAKYASAHAEDVATVDDLKTKRDERLVDYVRNRGPKRSELFQTHLYADLLRRGKIKRLKRQEALADLGPIEVEKVRLRYLARNAGAEYVYEQAYDPDITAEAHEWADQVRRSKSPEDLPRDEDGPGLSVICDNCPFRTACWGDIDEDGPAPQAQLLVTDADLAATLAEYADASLVESEAKARKAKARQVLDATGPAVYADGERAFKLGWSGGKMGDPKPDLQAMIDLFKQAGLEVPYLQPRPSAKSIRVTRWDPPERECGKPVVTEADLDRRPYVEDAKTLAEAVQRSARIDDEEADGLDLDDPRRDEVLASCARWEAILDQAPRCSLKKSHSGTCTPLETLDTTEPLSAPLSA